MHIGQAKVQRTKRTTSGFRVAAKKPPREQLKDLIERSGLDLAEVARRMGFPHSSSLHRYTRKDVMEDRPINVGLVRKLLPVIKGLGNPSITVAEIMALTELPLTGAPTAAQPLAPHIEGVRLELRYVVDRTAYRKLEDMQGSGLSPICSTPHYDTAVQFVVQDGGEYLHCVDRTEFDPTKELMGRRVVVAVPYGKVSVKTGLYSLDVERVSEKMQGMVLGVVIGSYTRE